MAEIVNLRRVRKDRARQKAKQTADSNAALHGRSKAEAALEEARAAKARRDHDAHKRDPESGNRFPDQSRDAQDSEAPPEDSGGA